MYIYTNILQENPSLFYPLMFVRTWVRVPPVTLTHAIMVIRPWALDGYLWTIAWWA